MLDALIWFFKNLALAYYNLGYALTHPSSWLAWTRSFETPEDKESLMRFVFYGASVEFFFVIFAIFLTITAIGIFSRPFLWSVVRGSEATMNWIGRIAAWAGLLMVLQQVMIVFLQRIFRVSEISVGPFGTTFTRDLSWYSEELKLYNAIIVCLCVSWTFIQGGHVRVDLVYSAVGHRTKRAIDMFGSLIFMMPALVLIWMYGWYYLWGSLISPRLAADADLDKLFQRARGVRWNVETIGFSPNGFDAYWMFKVLITLFAATVFIQACTFFWRSWLEFREGELSADRYLDRDILGDEDAERAAQIH
ncbi:TRAP transporter small permease subunit [Jannaschia pohangensis]|uniref:TRAP transporter small permease protein n=1 Tax=Jannaschia pohangensis TaxID=390807 RepID=A0A1I3HX65_9RHOB|nr:TRAP transporter small permease subunit [Jannaschia pohangensis]SFI40358.1 TRAP-type mannitol/chloroaromatic compound transport system, small permease component [Jannaschia pohangensis]